MKKYAVSNILFTFAFLLIITPLFYLLVHYVLSTTSTSAAAKESLSDLNISPSQINRDFSRIEEHADKVTILTYHQIIPENQLQAHHFTESGELITTIVTLKQFIEQMNYLKEHDYTVLTLKEFEQFMTNKKKVPAKSVLITFDDGYKNIFEFAYPVLKEHGFYAVHFIITGLITERTEPFDPNTLQYASIKELKTAADVFDYGSHTHSFHQQDGDGVAYLLTYTAEKIKEDLVKANDWLGHSIAFAAPYGKYNTATLEILRDLDVEMAFTIDPGYAEPSQHILEIPRQGIYPALTMQDFEWILTFQGKNH